MMYKIEFDDEAKKTIAKLKKSNPQTFKKVTKLLEDIALHPRTGIGYPEPLKGGADITYSRHIKGKDRIIYDIYDDIVSVLIVSAEGHYDDK